jgi:hypothetical protein
VEEKAPGQVLRVGLSSLGDRQLANAPEHWPKYGADLRKLHQYIHKGVRSPGAGMHFAVLKRKHRQAYRKLKAEAQKQSELL